MENIMQKCKVNTPLIYPPSEKIGPGHNFYMYINNEWLTKTQIPTYRSNISVSFEIQERIDKRLLELIDSARQYVLDNPSALKPADKVAVGRFAESIMRDKFQKNNVKEMKDQLLNLQCIRSASDISIQLGRSCVNRTCNILNVYAGPDELSSKHWRLHISPGSVGLPDNAYYKGSGPGGHRPFIAYAKMLQKAGQILGYDGMEKYAGLEADLADKLESSYEDDPVTLTGAEIASKFPAILWKDFWEQFGLNPYQWTTMKIVVDSMPWLKQINMMVRTLPYESWRLWFRGSTLMCYIRLLPPPFEDMHFSVFSKMLQGERRKLPEDEFMLETVKLWLTVPLSRLYIDCCMKDKMKKEIHVFIKKMFLATEKRLEQTAWLEKKTRNEAIRKIRNVKAGILYPDSEYNYNVPALLSDNLLKNIQLLGKSKSFQDVADVQQRFTRQTWENPVFMVNAFYMSAGNQLIIPAGIVQWPFYCENAGLGWNFGGLGCVIGHEITHAYDTDGKLFDNEGNRRLWWTAQDNREYNKRTKAIIALYNKAIVDGHRIDSEGTLMENIADIGGMGIALAALNTELDNKNIQGAKMQEEYIHFFTSYAISWREKMRKEKQLQQLLTDVHAPAMIRVNMVVPHFQEWYDAFNIKPESKLYIPPEQRIRIF
jgi:putative endopeptidase